jgi:hypothetical protein
MRLTRLGTIEFVQVRLSTCVQAKCGWDSMGVRLPFTAPPASNPRRWLVLLGRRLNFPVTVMLCTPLCCLNWPDDQAVRHSCPQIRAVRWSDRNWRKISSNSTMSPCIATKAARLHLRFRNCLDNIIGMLLNIEYRKCFPYHQRATDTTKPTGSNQRLAKLRPRRSAERPQR